MTRRVVAVSVALVLATGAAAARAASPYQGLVTVCSSYGPHWPAWCGGGFVISRSGLAVTSNDLIRDATSIVARDADNGHTYKATVVGYDADADVAVLRLTGASQLVTSRLGHSSGVEAGQPVFVYGSASTRAERPAALKGHILLPDQDFEEELTGLFLPSLLADDAPAGESFVGGPLVDGAGEVIGLTALGRAEKGVTPSGIDGALPIDRVRSIVNTIAHGKSSGEIHIGVSPVLGMTIGAGGLYDGLTTGVTVVSILPGSGLAHTGLARGDIIQSLNGFLLTSDDDLTWFLSRAHVGERVRIVWMGVAGGMHSATVSLTAGPPQ
jgi:S1-C subfamily serine protease